MKIRWTAESVRFRISPSELAALEQGETIETLLILGETAAWSAEIVPQASAAEIHLEPGKVRIMLSVEDGLRLAAPDAEGVYFKREGDPKLRYYIEKDFPCAHPRPTEANEPPQETFEPPSGFEERKAPPLPAGNPSPAIP